MTLYYANGDPIQTIPDDERLFFWFERMNHINKDLLSSTNAAPLGIISNSAVQQHATADNLGIANTDSPDFANVSISQTNYENLAALEDQLLTTSNVEFLNANLDSLEVGDDGIYFPNLGVIRSTTNAYFSNTVGFVRDGILEVSNSSSNAHQIEFNANGSSYIEGSNLSIGKQTSSYEFDTDKPLYANGVYQSNERVFTGTLTANNTTISNVINASIVAANGGTFTGNVDFQQNVFITNNSNIAYVANGNYFQFK